MNTLAGRQSCIHAVMILIDSSISVLGDIAYRGHQLGGAAVAAVRRVRLDVGDGDDPVAADVVGDADDHPVHLELEAGLGGIVDEGGVGHGGHCRTRVAVSAGGAGVG